MLANRCELNCRGGPHGTSLPHPAWRHPRGRAISLRLLGIRYIPHGRVGIVEKLWSGRGNMKDGGSIGYIYARDGEPLPPTQTLGRTVPCNSFQDARAFLEHGGQRGRQRAILREGVYALNLGPCSW